jgi:G3E family GTPase
MSARIPVNLLTGFLGSGKTTLLRHLLTSSEFADCAVLINEFGEIGLDHHLIADVTGDVVLMQSGCICCTIRGDVSEAIRGLYARRERGEIAFRRLVIETTGLADPTPILATVMHEPQIRHHFALDNVIATVDAVNGELHLQRQPESVKQAALADRLIITKSDLSNASALDALEARLVSLNPTARRFRSANAPPPAAWLLGQGDHGVATAFAEVHAHRDQTDDLNRHDEHIRAFAVSFDVSVDWNVFAVWFTLLLDSHGMDILRVKGLLKVSDATGPVAINAAQHLVHPPVHLEKWPDDWQQSRLIFIARDLAPTEIQHSFAAFQALLRAGASAAA